MRLTFDPDTVARLMQHARSCEEHVPTLRQSYNQHGARIQEPRVGPALWLVGDKGIYLMSNGHPRLEERSPGGHLRPIVAYAHQCDPRTMPVRVWWNVKAMCFGPQDGVEMIPLQSAATRERLSHGVIELTPHRLELMPGRRRGLAG